MFRRWAANVPTSAPSRRRGNSHRIFTCLPSTWSRMRGRDRHRRSGWPLAPLGRLDVLVFLHHLEDVADQLRRGADQAFGLAGGFRIADGRHRVVERILQHRSTSTVLPEAELVRDLAEALAAQVETVPPDDASFATAAQAASLPAEVFRPLHSTTSTL